MGNGIYVATAGAVSQSQTLDIVANNIANASTTGYRAQKPTFESAMADAQTQDLSFVRVGTTATDTRAGALKQTGNPLDLALVGDGFFAVETPRGPRYTRAGDFRLNSEGQLVNAAGLAARARGGGTISVPEGTSDLQVDATGRVLADGEEVGQLDVARFADAKMEREGANLFAVRDGRRLEQGLPEIVAGSLEQSNVNIVRGVVDMVRVSRSYESMLRVVETYKQIDSRTARQVGASR